MNVTTQDPFLHRFFSRIPGDVAETFNDGQLDAIKRAFGSRTFGVHTVDIRLSMPFGARSFYFVLLAGRERRSRRRLGWERALRPLWTIANVTVVAAFVVVLCLALSTVLYAGKRAAHIDLVPGIDMLNDARIERALN
ncbi:MAG: hypothetical protein HC826_01270 [Rhodospirillales bacterium]|nr:hypothetical protein [Rhodospirillales bacterium]